eukprot:CAMPEP_0182861632 /NCGR_PEP_ID=MMETSP0034_2-20130328/5608_1 /TAXON_ID=156128 /ORGANISM="Nephroselmis pyriformis, Strain CCMP717" /LENGTH=214 /DNA_ID=CAMNT_0024993589 /DNA_START=12 /DNA_END=655 /DNA_ORIENTATION=+
MGASIAAMELAAALARTAASRRARGANTGASMGPSPRAASSIFDLLGLGLLSPSPLASKAPGPGSSLAAASSSVGGGAPEALRGEVRRAGGQGGRHSRCGVGLRAHVQVPLDVSEGLESLPASTALALGAVEVEGGWPQPAPHLPALHAELQHQAPIVGGKRADEVYQEGRKELPYLGIHHYDVPLPRLLEAVANLIARAAEKPPGACCPLGRN